MARALIRVERKINRKNYLLKIPIKHINQCINIQFNEIHSLNENFPSDLIMFSRVIDHLPKPQHHDKACLELLIRSKILPKHRLLLLP